MHIPRGSTLDIEIMPFQEALEASAAPSADYKEFIKSEVRYSSLMRAFPDRAEVLFDKAEKNAAEKYEHLEKLAGK